ncbi:MAG: ATP-binding protein, partial [Deltaproteobacteria bacterium]|nr:ATP-binding protein [Deltaproteobacteria bacterium]
RSADDEAISQFSYLSLNRRGQEVLDLLRLIEPRLRRIEVLSLNGRRPDVFVDIEDAGPLLSLRMMGDGLNRAFDIGVSILASQDGVLCVDEIDSGLHHTTLDRMFRWLSASAEAESVQVFATTHSEECVHAARAAFPEGNDAFRLIRLDRTTKGIEAKLYNRDLVLAAQEMGVEIRG